MFDSLRIRVRPRETSRVRSFEDVLAGLSLPKEEVERLRAYMQSERRERARYHERRYLRHLTEDELHLRIGSLIANVVFISHRNRYSTNNLYSNYWQARLAHTAEELVVRGSTRRVSSDVLRHLPRLGFSTPQPNFVESPDLGALYRYDQIEYLKSLRERGEIYLRCGSTRDPTNDFARNDANEMCMQLRLLAEDLDLESTSGEFATDPWVETINFDIWQRTDFFMFCLSQVYDWRLFGDFNVEGQSNKPNRKIGCLVITDPREFARRFAIAVETFKSEHGSAFAHQLKWSCQPAFYYDACDPDECAPLFERRELLPFAKRREFTYQREFRFVIRPNIPHNFVPDCAPEALPQFQRNHLYLGSLEDISHIVEPEQVPDVRPYYLSDKDATLLASAIGVTLPNSGSMVRFVHSFEARERGRTDLTNLVKPKRYSGGSMGGSNRDIDVPARGNPARMLEALRDFYTVFDVREHGNHLLAFQGCDPSLSWKCSYRAYLPCAEPADDKLEPNFLSFEFEYRVVGGAGITLTRSEVVGVDGYLYQAQYNGVGPLHAHITYRSLLIAEMEFIDRLIRRGAAHLVSYRVRNRETDYPCSEFEVAAPANPSKAPEEPSPLT